MALALKTTKLRIGCAALFAILTPPTLMMIPMTATAPAGLTPSAMLMNYSALVLGLGVAPFIFFIPGWIVFHRRGLRLKAAALWGAVWGAVLAAVVYLATWAFVTHRFATLRQFAGIIASAALINGCVQAAVAVGVWWIAYRGSPTTRSVAASFD